MSASSGIGPAVSLHQQCRDMIKSLLIPRPWNLEVFRASLEDQRNRLLILTAVPGSASLWIATANADYIFYENDTTASRQLHLIGHQVAHILFGHEGTSVRGNVARALFPDLDPDIVAAALTLSAYTSAEEQAADVFASLLRSQSRTGSDQPDG
jgi:hypothetical protein